MKKTGYIILILASLLVFGASCNKTKTYADLLKEENRAIDKFISKNKLVILNDFPKNGVFKANEFYRDPATGVYYNIIDVGDTITIPKIKVGEEVYVRFNGLNYFSKEDTVKYNNMDPIKSPLPATLVFRGEVTVANRSFLYSGTTPGWVVPLKHVGHTGKAKMIVPFNMGSPSDQSAYTPTYYELVQYRFE